MSAEEVMVANARANQKAKERRERDPEHVRALERAKYARRLARDGKGVRAKRRAIGAAYRQRMKNEGKLKLSYDPEAYRRRRGAMTQEELGAYNARARELAR